MKLLLGGRMRSRLTQPGCIQAALGLVALGYLASLWLLPQSNPIGGLLFVLGLSAVSGIYTYVVSVHPTQLSAQRPSEPAAGIPLNTGEEAQAAKTSLARAGEATSGAVEAHGPIEEPSGSRADAEAISTTAPLASVEELRRLPAPPEDFAGREREIDELQSATQQPGVTVLGLSGPGGVGKTALALELANILAADYPDAQFFIELQANTGTLTPAAVMGQVIHTYRPLDKLPSNPAEMQAAYRNVLHGQRALLVFDNAQGREQASLLPPPPGCLMLVTSREFFTLPGTYVVALGGLSLEAAVALLLRLAPRIGERAAVLAEVCGRLPLALRLAGGTLAEREDVDPAEYASRLQAEQSRLTGPNEAEASLTVSYGLLTPEQQRHWRQLAVFPAGFDRPAAAAVWVPDGDSAGPALGELLAYGLLAYDHRLERYRLHDLARLAADARLKAPERDEAQQRHAAYYRQVLAAADQLWVKGGDDTARGLRLFDLEQGNVLAGQAWAAERAGQDDSTAKLASDYLVAGANVLALRQQPQERIAWLIAARTAAQRLGGP
jgi:predicted ATPase